MTGQIRNLVGEEGATAVQAMVASANKPATGAIATVAGMLMLLFGAAGLFGQLQDALDSQRLGPSPRLKSIIETGLALATAFVAFANQWSRSAESGSSSCHNDFPHDGDRDRLYLKGRWPTPTRALPSRKPKASQRAVSQGVSQAIRPLTAGRLWRSAHGARPRSPAYCGRSVGSSSVLGPRWRASHWPL